MNYVTEEQYLEASEEMLVETMAKEFPEFMLAIAEENWIRGYHQGLSDVDAGKELVEEFGEVGSD